LFFDILRFKARSPSYGASISLSERSEMTQSFHKRDLFRHNNTPNVIVEANVNESEPDESLMEILNTTLPKEDYGPDIQNGVAESVSRLFANKQPKEKLDSYKTQHKLPNNCKSLGISKVNPEIWNMLPQKIKQADYVHQLQQQQISPAAYVESTSIKLCLNLRITD
jgi:hypothetical protein